MLKILSFILSLPIRSQQIYPEVKTLYCILATNLIQSWHIQLTSEDLVEEDLDMVDSQWLLGYNDTMKITLH